MSQPRFEQVDDHVDILEYVWNLEDSTFDEVRATLFTFAPETRPEARTGIVAVLNANMATLAPR